MVFAIVILTIAIGFLIIERQIIGRSVTALPLRIHVNGTRGKSSVTLYIAAGLSSTDPAVMAKITGVSPSIISSGIVQVLGRKGVARVQEQFYIIRLAARRGIKNLVLECMSISPELQQLESRFFKPHYYVITNIRDDHREEMGKSLRQQAESICNAIPGNCTVVTSETVFLDMIRQKAAEKGSSVIVPDKINFGHKQKLPYGVFPENFALALKVCTLAGIDSKQSETFILKSVKNEKLPYQILSSGNKEFRFLNAFAVNDVGSTESFIEYWQKKLSLDAKYSVLLNTRADRPLRTDQFTSWISSKAGDIDRVLVCGSHAGRAFLNLRKSGLDKDKIFLLKNIDLNDLKNTLYKHFGDGSFIVGLGNIGGQGRKIMEVLA